MSHSRFFIELFIGLSKPEQQSGFGSDLIFWPLKVLGLRT
jgi:hypothetical protein